MTPDEELDQSFAMFWNAYPRHTAKVDARKAWGQVAPTPAVVHKMLSAIEWQRRQKSWRKDGGDFIPYPATWIRGHRWDDEPLQVRPVQRDMAAWATECRRMDHQPWCPCEEVHTLRCHREARERQEAQS